jgi:hypothetical protein
MKKVFGIISAMAMTVALSSSAPVKKKVEVREYCGSTSVCSSSGSACTYMSYCSDDLYRFISQRHAIGKFLYGNDFQ